MAYDRRYFIDSCQPVLANLASVYFANNTPTRSNSHNGITSKPVTTYIRHSFSALRERIQGVRLEMRRRLSLVTTLLVVIVLLAAGCAGHPKGMKSIRWLTDAEKEKVIEIALNTPEALQAREACGSYKTRLGWVWIKWHGHATGLFGLDYDYEQSEEWISEHVPKSAELYSEVTIDFGEPTQCLLSVAINPDTGKVAHVEWLPFTPAPTPKK